MPSACTSSLSGPRGTALLLDHDSHTAPVPPGPSSAQMWLSRPVVLRSRERGWCERLTKTEVETPARACARVFSSRAYEEGRRRLAPHCVGPRQRVGNRGGAARRLLERIHDRPLREPGLPLGRLGVQRRELGDLCPVARAADVGFRPRSAGGEVPSCECYDRAPTDHGNLQAPRRGSDRREGAACASEHTERRRGGVPMVRKAASCQREMRKSHSRAWGAHTSTTFGNFGKRGKRWPLQSQRSAETRRRFPVADMNQVVPFSEWTP